MMAVRDMRIVDFISEAPVTSISIALTDPLTLEVRGSGYSGVSRVEINGVASPEFIIVNETKLLAQVPASQLTAVLTSISVYLSSTDLNKNTALSFNAALSGVGASGYTRLLQTVFKVLLTTPGEDLRNPVMGGGLGRLLGNITPKNDGRASVMRAITATQDQIISMQAASTKLTPKEKLRSIELTKLSVAADKDSIIVGLRVTAQDGTSFVSEVGL